MDKSNSDAGSLKGAVKGAIGGAKVLGVFSLMMISIGSVLSVRNYPSMALYGWSSIGWYIFGAVCFLIPLTLASAELATGWHEEGGGVYSWVKAAWGPKSGFVAIFCEWSNNLVWFPTVLSYIAGSFAYAINPDLAKDGWFIFTVMMISFWGCTAMAFLGSKVVSRFNNAGVLLGSIVPSILLVVFGIAYLTQGKPLQIPAFTPSEIVPSIDSSTIPFMATVVLLFAGMEMSGFHALEVRNPKRDYPRGMFLAVIVIIIISVFGTLALSWVIPAKDVQLESGIMQAFETFSQTFNVQYLIKPLALLTSLGGIALMMNYLIGPILGLRATAADGHVPKIVEKQNKRGVPTSMLILQGIITTCISLLFVFMPSVNSAYWLLTAMTVAVLCIMYMLLFSSVIRLRFTKPNVERSFKIPGGKIGVFIIGGLGFFATAFTFIVSFMPSSMSGTSISFATYVIVMIIGVAVMSLPPLFYMRFKKS